MQRVSSRAFLLTAATAGALVAGFLVVFMLSMGSQATPKAQAIVPTFTFTPTPTCVTAAPTSMPNKCLAKGTPTPPPGGISGVYDIAAVGTKANPIYRCIARIDEYGAPHPALTLKSAAVCYVDPILNIGDTRAEPPAGSLRPNPNPAYPWLRSYTTLGPQKGYGNIIGGTLHTWSCFRNIGATANPLSLGPNVIAELIIPDFQNQISGVSNPGHKADAGTGALAPFGGANTGVYLYTKQGEKQCDDLASGILPAKAAVDHTVPGAFVQITTANSADVRCTPNCALAPWRLAGNVLHGYPDWDGDKCTDADELWTGKPGAVKCGDDPWNPNDVTAAHSDVAGIWSILVTAKNQDVCKGGTWKHQGEAGAFDCTGKPDGTIIDGAYYTCDASITQAVQALTAKVLCYIDFTNIVVSPDMAPGNATTCPPAPATFCGDGSPGASPPGCTDTAAACTLSLPPNCPTVPCTPDMWLFAHVNNPVKGQTTLTGTFDKINNFLDLEGCFNTSSLHPTLLGNVYVKAKINPHTGHGLVSIWSFLADCKTAIPTSPPTSTLPIDIVRQACVAPGTDNWCDPARPAATWDSDGDGCPDVKELSDNQNIGGLRDPSNRWDFFNPEKVNTPNTQTVADILKVVQQFGKDQGNPAYTIDTDRTALAGGNAWNLGPPDGKQTVADILAAVKQFGQNCS